MVDVVFRVNRVSTHSAAVAVQYEGETTTAMMPELEVELECEGQHGSLMLRFRKAAEVATAKEMFADGGTVKASFVKGETVEAVNTDLTPAEPAQA